MLGNHEFGIVGTFGIVHCTSLGTMHLLNMLRMYDRDCFCQCRAHRELEAAKRTTRSCHFATQAFERGSDALLERHLTGLDVVYSNVIHMAATVPVHCRTLQKPVDVFHVRRAEI